MSSLFDFDNSQDLVFQAKTAGKQIILAKHEALTKLGAFLFLAHSDQEFALRCQMFDNDITAIANRRLATVSDSKGKLVRALHAEWTMRHANCKCANKGDQKDCAECGAPATEHDVRGYLELCANCAGKKSASINDNLKGTSSSSDSPLNEAENVAEPVWSKKTRTVESSADSPATTPPSTTDPGTPADAANASTTVPPMNTNSNSDSGHNMNSVPSMTAGIKSAHSSCDCGEETIGNFNGKPSCLPGMGCKTDAQPGACPGCNKSFHGFNACPNGNCQGNPQEDAIMREVQMLRKQLEDLIGNGESLETVKRHDEGHDDWHRSMGQEPCTSEEDCAAKAQEHEAMEHEQHTSKKKKKEDHYKYIKKQGDSWVVTQKGTGKVLSHHDSKEKAIASFKAMMMNKHG